MKTYQTLTDLPQDAVLMIGNFDGVHEGHQALIRRAISHANKHGKRVGLLTFEPHPRAVFRPDDPPFRITPFAVKADRLSETGIDFTVALNFDWAFASQSADQFVQNILIDALNPALVMVGNDFRFGQLRKGSPKTIADAGIAVDLLDDACDEEGIKYSSSVVREALRRGDIKTANAILGWDWYVQGTIVKGDRRGHELGYPTANVPLGDTLHPAYGVYATLVQIEGETLWRPAATNIGIRPMFELEAGQVEAYILDFPETDLYGKTLKIKPIVRLRGEAKFDSLPALIKQIEQDVAHTRKIITA